MDAPQKTEVETPERTQPPEPEGRLPASPLDRPSPSKSASRALLAVAIALAFAVGGLTGLVANTSRRSLKPAQHPRATESSQPAAPTPAMDDNVVMVDDEEAQRIKI